MADHDLHGAAGSEQGQRLVDAPERQDRGDVTCERHPKQSLDLSRRSRRLEVVSHAISTNRIRPPLRYPGLDQIPRPSQVGEIPGYYLRITQILETRTILNAFTLGFNRHLFDRAAGTWTDEGAFTARMRWVTAPAGYPSPGRCRARPPSSSRSAEAD